MTIDNNNLPKKISLIQIKLMKTFDKVGTYQIKKMPMGFMLWFDEEKKHVLIKFSIGGQVMIVDSYIAKDFYVDVIEVKETFFQRFKNLIKGDR
jgi:hypothetical protein